MSESPEISDQIHKLLGLWLAQEFQISEFEALQKVHLLAENMGRLFQGWASQAIIKDRLHVLNIFAEVMKTAAPDMTLLKSATIEKNDGTN